MSLRTKTIYENGRTAKGRQRHAATTVESAVVLSVLVVLLFGMLELALALVRHTAICEAARRVAREAIVHGAMAPDDVWGPAVIETKASGDHGAAVAAREVLMTLDPDEVDIRVEWPDGGNQPDDRVLVTIDFSHRPVISLPGWYSTLELQSISGMRVAH